MYLLRLVSGLFFILLFLLPYGELDSSTKDLKHVYSSKEWLLSIFIISSIAWLISLFLKKEISLSKLSGSKLIPPILIILCIIFSFYLGDYSFHFKPHLIDSIVQIWQAKIFSHGELYTTYKEPVSFFVSQHMLFDNGKMYAQYPPGNSLLITLNYLFSIPNFSGLLCALITLICTYRFAKREYNQSVANLNLLFFSISGFFLFNTQSYMNHVPGLAFAAAFLDFYSLWKKEGKITNLIIIGFSLSLIFLCRPLEGALLVLIFGFSNLRKFKSLVIAGISFSLIGSLYFIFNYYTTGDPLLPGYIKLWGKAHDIGFHTSPWGDEHTFSRGLGAFYINLKLLNEYLFESPIPPLSLLGIFLVIPAIKLKYWDKFLALISFLIPFIYVFYWHRDSFLGPRYTYIALAFFLPLLSNAVYSLAVFLEGKKFPQSNSSFRQIYLKNFLVLCLFLSLIFVFLVGLPIRAKVYSTSFISMKEDLLKDLPPESKEGALIFVKVSFGTRLIASMRELGLSASLTENIYRSVDHCQLFEKIKEYKLENTPKEQVEAELSNMMLAKNTLHKVPINGDPSFRIISEASITPECRAEIDYDLKGYTLYEPHMLLNEPGFTSKLVVARDMRDENKKLSILYPEIKQHYLWTIGKLEKLNL